MQMIDDEKGVKLDFIFANTGVAFLNDALYCEDKRTDKVSAKDKTKNLDLRSKSLLYWKSLLPYEECLQYLTATTCQFSKLKLTISATKSINGITIHHYLKEVNIPASDGSASSLAEYLAAVLSLKRAVVNNFKVIECIMRVVQDEDLKYMHNRSDISCFRDNSSCSSGSSSEVESLEWDEEERKERILSRINSEVESLLEEHKEKFASYSWEDVAFGDL